GTHCADAQVVDAGGVACAQGGGGVNVLGHGGAIVAVACFSQHSSQPSWYLSGSLAWPDLGPAAFPKVCECALRQTPDGSGTPLNPAHQVAPADSDAVHQSPSAPWPAARRAEGSRPRCRVRAVA